MESKANDWCVCFDYEEKISYADETHKRTITETEEKLKIYYLDFSPWHDMVDKWITEFCCGHTNTKDSEHFGYSIENVTEKMTNKIHDTMLEDHHVKMCKISKKVSISNEHVLNIFHKHLSMKK